LDFIVIVELQYVFCHYRVDVLSADIGDNEICGVVALASNDTGNVVWFILVGCCVLGGEVPFLGERSP
jgi:hypothetical protein